MLLVVYYYRILRNIIDLAAVFIFLVMKLRYIVFLNTIIERVKYFKEKTAMP